MAIYRVAVIGCGGRSVPHIKAYQHIRRAKVVACCDPDKARREKIATDFGVTPYAEAAEMIRNEKPDLVHNVTWPSLRVPLMTLMADLGVPAATVEKPIATGVADWRALVELERRAPTRFAVCHQCRWQPHLVKCRQALASGRLGKVLLVDASAGMNISGQGTHILNYAVSLNGESPIVRVFGAASGDQEMKTAHPGPDTTVGLVTFANGVRCLWNNGPTAPVCGDPKTIWQHVRVAAYAERGRVLWEEFGRWEIVGPGGLEASGDYGGTDTWMANNLRAQAAFHEAMFDWIEDDRKVPGTSLAQSLHEWKAVLALYASAVGRRPVELGSFDPPPDLFDRLAKALAEN
ncbi:MAG TPA: Gfo/Idh/MocA family oxidoreductase [Phycisphaerae bacterium]|nr:Gfo/Idh/MocA family oxidoreductase [Phycisphaerae bacterium]